jgi:hypothetical protein
MIAAGREGEMLMRNGLLWSQLKILTCLIWILPLDLSKALVGFLKMKNLLTSLVFFKGHKGHHLFLLLIFSLE